MISNDARPMFSMLSHSIHGECWVGRDRKGLICFIRLIKSYILPHKTFEFCYNNAPRSYRTSKCFLLSVSRRSEHRRAENSQWTKLNWNVSHTTKMTLMDFQLTFCFLSPALFLSAGFSASYDGNIRMFGGNTCQNFTLYTQKTRGCWFWKVEARMCVC